jgi:deoxyadenosine/deoxycytidine kinase
MFIVEGNIGAGKSTFLSLLKASGPDLTIIQEPVHNWASERYGQSLLEEFYKQPDRWAFTIETFAMLARSLDHVRYQKNTKTPVIMERSIYSGHYCFAQNGLQEGYFNDIEWAVYLQWVNFILHQQCQAPTGFIYLKTSPEVCHARINKRNRSGEDLVSLAYLRNIHDRHEKFLVTKESLDLNLHDVPVLVLDVTEEFQADAASFEHLRQKMATFVSESRKIARRAQ